MVAAGIELGRLLIPEEHPILRGTWGFIASLAGLMLIRGAWFYAGLNLNDWGEIVPEIILFLAIALLFAITSIIARIRNTPNPISPVPTSQSPIPIIWLPTLLISLTSFVAIAVSAARAGTEQSIRTPWPLMPNWTLALIAMQWIFTATSIWKLKSRWIAAIQTTCAIASTAVIAPLIYRIGYGFDGFLHVAGEKILLETGTLLPHPMYYMGQYLLTTWIARVGELNIVAIDRWLVPVTASILLPLALLASTRRDQKISRFIGLGFIPLAPFVATTPHGFSIVLACTAILLSIGTAEHEVHPALPVLISLWCALTHPLVGLPILGATIALGAYKHGNAWRTSLAFIIALGGSLAVPVMFGLASAIGSSGGVNFHLNDVVSVEKWKPIIDSWNPWLQNRYAIWAESSIWIEKLLPILCIVLALVERIRRYIKHEACPPWLIAAGGTAASALILKIAGDFGFLIDYERGNYADRLWIVAWILILPLVIPLIGRLIHRMREGHSFSIATALTAIGILTASMSYAALPRHDAVTPSRGWSVGLADIEAVKLIDEDSNGAPYTVLANQSVSAAAVRTFGFKRYHGDVFFYPIPTGGSLYEVFLKASYGNPSLNTMSEAARLGGSNLVYFVLNDYWWKSDELAELAKKDATRVFEIQGGKVKVFKYDQN